MLQIITVTTITLPKLMMLPYHPKFSREENCADGAICKTLLFLFGEPILADLWETVSVADPYCLIFGGLTKKMWNIKNENFKSDHFGESYLSK